MVGTMERPHVWPSVNIIQHNVTAGNSWPTLFLSSKLYRDRGSDISQASALNQKPDKPNQSSTSGRSLGRNCFTRLVNGTLAILSIPCYLIPRRGQPVRAKAVHELHHLAYLDALRGYLALIIFTAHTMSRFWRWIPQSILSIPWLQFPFRGGFASLDIFFWISGYTITYRILGFIHAKRSDKVLDALASSVFRRYTRLFLPILPITLITAIAVSTGIAIPPENKANVVKGNPVWWWMKDTTHLLNPFTNIRGWWDGETGSELLDPLWSLSAEFRSSMILYIFLTGTCKMPARRRQLLIWLCIPPFMAWQAQWSAMAFLGMWFAEVRQHKLQKERLEPEHQTKSNASDQSAQQRHDMMESGSSPTTSVFSRLKNLGSKLQQPRWRQPLLYLLFIYSFIVLQDPYTVSEKTGFVAYVLNAITPKHWHPQMRTHLHQCVGAFMMLYPLDRLYLLQRPLLSPFSQYLGELSFGIYAVHFPVRWVVWDARYVKWQSARYKDEFDRFWVLFPGYLCMAILVLWAADLFRRLDVQVVRFCKHLETVLFE